MAWPAGSVISGQNESKAIESFHWFNDADIIALCEDVYLICKQLAERQHCVTPGSQLSGAVPTLSVSTFNALPLLPNASGAAGAANGMKMQTGIEADDTKPRAPTGYVLSEESPMLML